jgi:hypothetical protein
MQKTRKKVLPSAMVSDQYFNCSRFKDKDLRDYVCGFLPPSDQTKEDN